MTKCSKECHNYISGDKCKIASVKPKVMRFCGLFEYKKEK